MTRTEMTKPQRTGEIFAVLIFGFSASETLDRLVLVFFITIVELVLGMAVFSISILAFSLSLLATIISMSSALKVS